MRARWTVLSALVLTAVAACARQSAPPGGPPDARPPVVTRTVPDALADVPDFRGPVRFEFDERVSEQVGGGTLDDAVTVSPTTGGVRVEHGRRSLTVELEGGFRPGVVYRITLQPVVRDLFGNTMRDPFELVFTTGAEPQATAVAGEIWDRVTGRGVQDLSIHATGRDSLTYVARSGENGIYAMRYLPGGAYDLVAFQDQDRDGGPDPLETQGRTTFEVAAGDTLFLDVPVLAPDTSRAVLLGAEALDSVTVALRFDDYLDPGVPLEEAEIRIVDAAGAPLGITRSFHEVPWGDVVAAARDSIQRADSIAAALAPPVAAQPPAAPPTLDSLPAGDSLVAADSLRTGAQRAAAAPPRGPPALTGPAIPGLAAARARGRVLPGRRLVLLLERPLAVGATYTVTVEGVVNLNGVTGGGGEVELTRAAPESEGGGAP